MTGAAADAEVGEAVVACSEGSSLDAAWSGEHTSGYVGASSVGPVAAYGTAGGRFAAVPWLAASSGSGHSLLAPSVARAWPSGSDAWLMDGRSRHDCQERDGAPSSRVACYSCVSPCLSAAVPDRVA